MQNQPQYRSYEVLATFLHICSHNHADGFSLNVQQLLSNVTSADVTTADGSSCKESEKVFGIGQLGKRLFKCTAVSPTADEQQWSGKTIIPLHKLMMHH